MSDESPYTKVPNHILDFEGFDVYEYRVFMFILRKTIGFNKKSDGISLSQFVKATSISKSKVNNTLEKLKKRGVLNVQKQILKNGGKSYNRYIPLVHEKHYLVHEKDKGSTPQSIGLVSEKDIQKENRTKENRQKREREIININIYFDLSENEKLRETDKYISHLIESEDYIKNEKSFKLKIKRQLANEDKYQLEDFERWYLEKECESLKDKYVGKYIDDDLISNIYPYFHTEKYEPNDKFIIWFNQDSTDSYTQCFSNRFELKEILEEAVSGTI